MKYHIALKFILVFLCACFLFLTLFSAVGVLLVAESGLYNSSVEDILQKRMESNLYAFSNSLANRYAAKNLSNCPDQLIEEYVYDFFPPLLTKNEQRWFYSIKNQRGQILESRILKSALDDALKLEFLITPQYPVVLDYQAIDDRPTSEQDPLTQALPGEFFIPEQETLAQEYAEAENIEMVSYEDEEGVTHNYCLEICEGPMYLVTLYILPGAYAQEDHWSWELARLGHGNRFNLLWLLAFSALLFAATLVCLCCVAGKESPKDAPVPGGLNRIPLDIYAAVVVVAVTELTAGAIGLLNWYLGHFEPMWMVFLGIGTMGLLGSLLIVALLFALAAQVKVGGKWMLRHTFVGWFCVEGFRLLCKVFYAGKKILIAAWSLIVKAVRKIGQWIKALFSMIWRGIRRFCDLLPLAWQWLLVAGVIILVLWVTLDTGIRGAVLGIAVCILLVLYGAYCYGMLLESTKQMSKGNLDTKVDDRLLLGSFREYAEHLNALADVVVEAARKQMKSEQMKTELITNISHDIKTPLTSIINYVDLMQNAQSPEEAQAYLEVLGRQSQRMKKLIEDLMEMSKASTGNMNVELTEVDAVEAVNQALGEFHEKLESAELTPVFVSPEEPVPIVADGRLAWRVMSNLLSNAVKYAMPGTRLYIDILQDEKQVRISMKNVSKEQLNVSPEELMERFVRGDLSRNTEGSGLGLNIAGSLMELQKGKLELQVDGDLFKATMVFPSDLKNK